VSNDGAGLRDFLNFQPGENHEGFVSAIFGVSPAVGNARIEEFGEHSIRIDRLIGHFKQASPLEFSETFQFTTGKAS